MPIKLNIKSPSPEESVATTSVIDTKPLNRKDMSIVDLLVFATENDCSDLYIKKNDYPYVSKFGKIFRLPCNPTSKVQWNNFYELYVSNELNFKYVQDRMLDTSMSIRVPTDSSYRKITSNFRYRVNFGYSDDNEIATFRMIKPKKPTFDTINYNKACMTALTTAFSERTGLIIEAGPTGSGKSTTLAACINTFTQPNNILDNRVIITLEDPIENEFDSTDSVKINQKELGKDFLTFSKGIKSALREHPDVIIVGEMRDKEVISTAIEAGRTGHLVSTTFHASNVGTTISRILDHLENDKNLAYDLVSQLNIVIAQRMLQRDNGYFVDTQYLLFDEAITRYLINAINSNANVFIEAEKLVNDPKIQAAGLSKTWEFPDEVK